VNESCHCHVWPPSAVFAITVCVFDSPVDTLSHPTSGKW
jgi:hypothetical protein